MRVKSWDICIPLSNLLSNSNISYWIGKYLRLISFYMCYPIFVYLSMNKYFQIIDYRESRCYTIYNQGTPAVFTRIYLIRIYTESSKDTGWLSYFEEWKLRKGRSYVYKRMWCYSNRRFVERMGILTWYIKGPGLRILTTKVEGWTAWLRAKKSQESWTDKEVVNYDHIVGGVCPICIINMV